MDPSCEHTSTRSKLNLIAAIAYAAIVAASLAVGYMVGKASPSRAKPLPPPTEVTPAAVHESESESDSDGESVGRDGDLSQLNPDAQEDCKMVRVISWMRTAR